MKTRKFVLMGILILLLAGISEASEVVKFKLPDLVRPRYVDVDDKMIYIINDYVNIQCFSLTGEAIDFKMKIGKGEGPSEYHCPPMIDVEKDRIVINTTKKTGFYNRDGSYIGERVKKNFASSTLYLGENKIKYGVADAKDNDFQYVFYDLYNGKGEKIKRIISVKRKSYKKQFEPKNRKLPYPILPPYESVAGSVNGNRFFVTFYQDQKVYTHIFDADCNLLKKIEHSDLKRIPVTEEEKKRALQRFEENFRYINLNYSYEEHIKQLDFKFPEYFPIYSSVFIDNDKIYIRTYVEKEGKRKVHVYDLQGTLLGELYLPFSVKSRLSKLKNGNYYYLEFCDDEEEWYLHTIKLKY